MKKDRYYVEVNKFNYFEGILILIMSAVFASTQFPWLHWAMSGLFGVLVFVVYIGFVGMEPYKTIINVVASVIWALFFATILPLDNMAGGGAFVTVFGFAVFFIASLFIHKVNPLQPVLEIVRRKKEQKKLEEYAQKFYEKAKEAQRQQQRNTSNASNAGRSYNYGQGANSSSQSNGSAGNNVVNSVNKSPSYFDGCNDAESLKTRYRDLCKVFHPDMGNGSAEVFADIQKEYDRLKERYK